VNEGEIEESMAYLRVRGESWEGGEIWDWERGRAAMLVEIERGWKEKRGIRLRFPWKENERVRMRAVFYL